MQESTHIPIPTYTPLSPRVLPAPKQKLGENYHDTNIRSKLLASAPKDAHEPFFSPHFLPRTQTKQLFFCGRPPYYYYKKMIP